MPSIDSLWVNANLATFADNSYSIINNAALAIHDGTIAWVGKMSDLPKKFEKEAPEIYDVQDAWMLPGFIDCHTHLVYGGNRADEFEMRLQGKSYQEIAQAGGGIQSTVKATQNASFEELLKSATIRLRNYLKEGVTTLEIKSGYGIDFATEKKCLLVAKEIAKIFPITVKTTYLGAHVLPKELKNNPDEYINLITNEFLPKLHKENLIDYVDGFCETIAFTKEQLEVFFNAAKKLKLGIKIHAEQLSHFGGTQLAAKFKALSCDHLEFANEDDVKALKKSGTTAVLLPGAFYFLREKQLPPVDLLRKHKVPIAISTDCNPGTSPNTSLMLTTNMASVLFGLTPEESLLGITINAARALGMENSHGSIEVGKVADLSIWDINHPRELVYQLGNHTSSGVVKSGRKL